jgi:hypothetical protein
LQRGCNEAFLRCAPHRATGQDHGCRNAARTARLQLTLTVWADPAAPWHARAVLADATTLEFENPFELARFLSWPVPPPPRAGGGLR